LSTDTILLTKKMQETNGEHSDGKLCRLYGQTATGNIDNQRRNSARELRNGLPEELTVNSEALVHTKIETNCQGQQK